MSQHLARKEGPLHAIQDSPFPKPNQSGDDETESIDDSEIPNNLQQTSQELAMLDP